MSPGQCHTPRGNEDGQVLSPNYFTCLINVIRTVKSVIRVNNSRKNIHQWTNRDWRKKTTAIYVHKVENVLTGGKQYCITQPLGPLTHSLLTEPPLNHLPPSGCRSLQGNLLLLTHHCPAYTSHSLTSHLLRRLTLTASGKPIKWTKQQNSQGQRPSRWSEMFWKVLISFKTNWRLNMVLT